MMNIPQQVVEPQPRLVLQKGYFKTIPGILKILQIFCGFLTFVLSVSVTWGHLGGGWVNFVGVCSLLNSLVWFVFYLFNAVPPVFINFFVELIAYSVLTCFLFIAGCVAGAQAHVSVLLACTIFAFFCFIFYLVDTLMQVISMREQWKQRNERRVPVPTQEPANI